MPWDSDGILIDIEDLVVLSNLTGPATGTITPNGTGFIIDDTDILDLQFGTSTVPVTGTVTPNGTGFIIDDTDILDLQFGDFSHIALDIQQNTIPRSGEFGSMISPTGAFPLPTDDMIMITFDISDIPLKSMKVQSVN